MNPKEIQKIQSAIQMQIKQGNLEQAIQYYNEKLAYHYLDNPESSKIGLKIKMKLLKAMIDQLKQQKPENATLLGYISYRKWWD